MPEAPVEPKPEELAATARCFGFEAERPALIRNVANAVYSIGAGDEICFLRLTHVDDHSAEQLEAEVEWLRFLVDRGLPVCRPLPARDGSFVVRASPTHSAVLLARVPGEPVPLARFDEAVFVEMGRFLGRLHAVSEGFQPADPTRVRPQWFECDPEERVLRSWNLRDPGDARVARTWREVQARLFALGRPEGGYGLVHADLHRGNLFLEAGKIAVFDFDDSCYFLLVSDIANALYYSLWDRRYEPEAKRTARAAVFLEKLVGGYREQHALDDEALGLLPDLLEYRDLSVDAFSHRRFPAPDAETARRWRHIRNRLAGAAPYVDLSGILLPGAR